MFALRERIRKSQKIGSGKAKELIDEAVRQGILVCESNRYRLAADLFENDNVDDAGRIVPTADNSMHDDDEVF